MQFVAIEFISYTIMILLSATTFFRDSQGIDCFISLYITYCDRASFRNTGHDLIKFMVKYREEIHVHCIWEEFANLGIITYVKKKSYH